MNGDEWLQAHEAAIQQVITTETEQGGLAHRMVPVVTVPEQTRTVSIDRLNYASGIVDDQTQTDIERFADPVAIPKLQTDDPDPARAFVAIRRSSQQLARRHDERVFRKEIADQIETAETATDPEFQRIVTITAVNKSIGDGAVTAVADAISKLDSEGYRSAYAMVASNTLWTELHRRGTGSATLPIDAVRALMDDGPVQRSSVLKGGDALLLSLGEGRVDRIVAEPPRLAFIDQSATARQFELYERFVPRLRETRSAVLLRV